MTSKQTDQTGPAGFCANRFCDCGDKWLQFFFKNLFVIESVIQTDLTDFK